MCNFVAVGISVCVQMIAMKKKSSFKCELFIGLEVHRIKEMLGICKNGSLSSSKNFILKKLKHIF